MRKLTPSRARLARIGDALIAPCLPRPGRPAPSLPPQRILVVELWNLGDLVLATPALQALRVGFPEARITLLASPLAPELLRHQNVVDEILPWAAPWIGRLGSARVPDGWLGLPGVWRRLRACRFDTALDFRGDFRNNALLWLSGAPRRLGFEFAGGGALLTDLVSFHPDRHQADQALDVVATLGAPTKGFAPKLWLAPDEIAEATCWLDERGIARGAGPLVALHPGAGWVGRRWEPARFARLGDALAEEFGARLLLLGGPDDAPPLRAVGDALRAPAVAVQPPLRRLVALLAAADVFVGSDSGPMHIATAVGTRAVALFGPQRPEWFGPYGEGHRVAIEDVPCRPCDQVACHRPEDSCMRRLEVAPVLALVREALSTPGARATRARPSTAAACGAAVGET